MISILGADGKSYGPVGVEQIRRWLAEGRASLQTLAQRRGEDTWRPLSEFHEFNPALPPPLPVEAPPLPGQDEGLEEAESDDSEAYEVEAAPPASRFSRFVASLLDTTLSLFFGLPGLFLLTMGILQDPKPLEELLQSGFAGQENAISIMMMGMLIPTVAQIWMLTMRGQTVGKWLLGIRIVLVETEEKAGFLRAVVLRGFVPGMIGSIPYVGAAFTLLNILFILRPDRRCLHDHIAGTKVIKVEEEQKPEQAKR